MAEKPGALQSREGRAVSRARTILDAVGKVKGEPPPASSCHSGSTQSGGKGLQADTAVLYRCVVKFSNVLPQGAAAPSSISRPKTGLERFQSQGTARVLRHGPARGQ